MKRHECVVFALSMVVMSANPADACSIARNSEGHTLDPEEQAIDRTPPSKPTLMVLGIKRGQPSGGCSHGSCDDVGTMTIGVLGSDDRTAPGKLGYRVEPASGNFPRGFSLPVMPIRLLSPAEGGGTGHMVFAWDDGEGGASLSFSISVVAIDLAGNESQPTILRISDGGSGCHVGGGGGGPFPVRALGCVLMGLCLRSRMKRRSHRLRSSDSLVL